MIKENKITKNIIKKLKDKIILNPYNNIVKIWINITYPILFRINKQEILEKKNNKNGVIVSLTSFPARINTVHYTIKSLLLQSYRPDKIILWLAKEEFSSINELPKNLTDLLGSDFEIRWCDNLKPHKKYIYTMLENPESIIITVDDDGYYRKNLVKDLISSYKKYPTSISCTRAHYMKFDSNGEILPYNEWIYEVKNIYTPSKFIFATGVGGVLYPPNSLDKRVFNTQLIKELCLNADDIWLKAMQILNNKSVVTIPSSKCKYVVGRLNSEKVCLYKNNVIDNQNDKYIRNVFSRFNIKYENFLESEI